MALIVDILTEQDLLAYVDGELERERAEAVEAWLEDNPEGQERVAQYHRRIRNGVNVVAQRPVRH